MTKSAVPGVLQTNVSTSTPGAYPLAMLTYAATTPETLSSSDRSKYASFIRYAVQAGQVTGQQPGQLPAGYVPLPSSLQSQALAATNTILNPPVETAPGSTSTTSSALSGSVPLSSYGSAAFPDDASTGSAATTQTSNSARRRAFGPAALTSVRTRGVPIGELRWILPIALLVGIAAGLVGLVMGRFGRAANAPSPRSESPAKGRSSA